MSKELSSVKLKIHKKKPRFPVKQKIVMSYWAKFGGVNSSTGLVGKCSGYLYKQEKVFIFKKITER